MYFAAVRRDVQGQAYGDGEEDEEEEEEGEEDDDDEPHGLLALSSRFLPMARRGRPLHGGIVRSVRSRLPPIPGRPPQRFPPGRGVDGMARVRMPLPPGMSFAEDKETAADATPQLDVKELCILLRLLRLSSWSGRTYLNRVFSNLAAAKDTRDVLTKVLLSILRCPMAPHEAGEAMGDGEDAAVLAHVADAGAEVALEGLGLITAKDKGVLAPQVTKRLLDLIHYLCRQELSSLWGCRCVNSA